jgi:hypothetical protein
MFHWHETDQVTISMQAKIGRTTISQATALREETTNMNQREVVVLPVLAGLLSLLMLFLRSPPPQI